MAFGIFGSHKRKAKKREKARQKELLAQRQATAALSFTQTEGEGLGQVGAVRLGIEDEDDLMLEEEMLDTEALRL